MDKTHSVHEHRFAHPPRIVAELGVEHGMKIADFGAGSGAYALLLAHAVGKSGRVYAVDAQRDFLRRIHAEAHHRGLQNIETLWGDVERPHGSKIADASLDLVLMSNILFQLSDMSAAFDEAWRILKPTGRLVVIEWSERPLRVASRGLAPIGPHREHVVGRERAIEMAQSRGFKLVREFPAGGHHYGLIFRLMPRHSKTTV